MKLRFCGYPQDGVVDFREYVKAISMLIEGTPVEKLRWSFKLYDKDKDGAISRREMLEIMQVGPNHRYTKKYIIFHYVVPTGRCNARTQ